MQKLIKSQDYKTMPWKNGQGSTAEIAISPEEAVFANYDFNWRISSATVKTAAPFSIFPGYERILAIWKGEGLILNGTKHDSAAPMKFSGEIPIDCVPINGEVTDLGIIYKRGKVKAEISTKIFAPKPVPQTFALEEGLHFLICTKGKFQAGEDKVETDDTLKVEGPVKITVETSQGANCFHIHIQE